MMGVIAIHVGAMALANPLANVQLISVLEILSRFAVPAFFFLSAFGLFYHTSIYDTFSYSYFLKRRIQVVLFPYLIWSVLYMLHTALTVHDFGAFHPLQFVKTLAFGTSYYHLYFMVILLWFYLLMPLWRKIVKWILPHAGLWLTLLFFLQMGVDFWSSYIAGKTLVITNPTLKYMFDMRLNYWIILYTWIFLLGAVIAEKYDKAVELMWKGRVFLTVGFIVSVLLMLSAYYYVMGAWHYTLLEAIYTVHQLSPMGVFYTGMGTVFFLFAFRVSPMNESIRAFWEQIGECSYGIYLIHPFMLLIISNLMVYLHLTYTVVHVIAIYWCALGMSYLATLAMKQLPKGIRKYILGN